MRKNELIIRQYTIEDRVTRQILMDKRKKNIDWFIADLKENLDSNNNERVTEILQELFLEHIGLSFAQIWINRINTKQTSLESFKRLYLLMAEYGFRPYHS
jgi:Uma2 family endonuclease